MKTHLKILKIDQVRIFFVFLMLNPVLECLSNFAALKKRWIMMMQKCPNISVKNSGLFLNLQFGGLFLKKFGVFPQIEVDFDCQKND